MKIKISDMFDNAAEIVEAESNYNNVIDSRKIKEIVFLRIHRSRRKRVKRQCIAVLIAVLGLSVISGRSENLTSIRWSDWNKQGGCFAVTGRNQYR